MKHGIRRVGLAVLLVIAIVALAAFISYGNFDLSLGVRSLVRVNAVQKAAAEAETRKERHGFDLKLLERESAVLRGEREALIRSRFGDAPAWAGAIRASYLGLEVCNAFLRWKAGNGIRTYFQQKPDRQFVTAEDLKTTHLGIEAMWREAGMAAAKALLGAIRTPSVVKYCDLGDVVEVSEQFINILAELELRPEDFGTTPAKIAALVRAAR